MISDRLFTLTKSLDLSTKANESIITNLLLYSLNEITNEELRIFLHQFDKDTRKKVLDLKQNFFDKTFYTISLWWRAVIALLNKAPMCKRCKWHDTCDPLLKGYCDHFEKSLVMVAKEFGVTERDLRLLEYLPQKWIKAIERDAKVIDYIEHPDSLYYDRMIKILIPYCQKIVYRKLRFICQYFNLDYEDLTNDLLTIALLVIIDNDYDKDFAHTINYAKRSIRERMKNIIEHYTTEKRARIVETDEGYKVTTLSMDCSNNEDEDLNFHSILPSSIDIVSTLETKDVLDKLMKECSLVQKKVVKAMLGQGTKGFIEWLKFKGEENYTSKIAKNAADYYKLSYKGLIQIGNKLIKIMGEKEVIDLVGQNFKGLNYNKEVSNNGQRL